MKVTILIYKRFRKYYFVVIPCNNRFVFHSISFRDRETCLLGIAQLQQWCSCAQHVIKTEEAGTYTFEITNGKNLSLGRGRTYRSSSESNKDLNLLVTEIGQAQISERW